MSAAAAASVNAAVDKDIKELVGFIKKFGTQDSDGSYSVKFGVLVKDDEVGDTLESLAGTLKAAKRRGFVKYDKELLLQGVSDNEIIKLVKEP